MGERTTDAIIIIIIQIVFIYVQKNNNIFDVFVLCYFLKYELYLVCT
jgi:hypothetical protein